jgi:proline iminopeptidase
MSTRFLTLFALIIAVAACVDERNLPDDGFVDVPGGRVAFRVIGDGPSTPALWIHGGPGSTSCGAVDHVSGIASERPVILYDQLGAGYSDRITDLDRYARLVRFVKEVTAIREELGLDELHLIGQSWGNAIALEYMLTADPIGIKSIVFVSPFFGTEQWLADGAVLLKQMPVEAQAVVAKAIEEEKFDSPEFIAVDNEFWKRHGNRTPREKLDLSACDIKPGGDSGLYEYMWGAAEYLSTGTLKDYDRIDRLAELDLPVLFVTGQYDQARPETVYYYQTLVEGSKVEVMPDSGHYVFQDQTVIFNDTLVDFFRSVDQSK